LAASDDQPGGTIREEQQALIELLGCRPEGKTNRRSDFGCTSGGVVGAFARPNWQDRDNLLVILLAAAVSASRPSGQRLRDVETDRCDRLHW